jgi:hypothetical protein
MGIVEELEAAEPPEVKRARRVIQRWEQRNGHAAYAEPLDGGHKGYQGACWDCDWRGAEYLRGNEQIGTEESRAHKRNAQREASAHAQATKPADPYDFSEC